MKKNENLTKNEIPFHLTGMYLSLRFHGTRNGQLTKTVGFLQSQTKSINRSLELFLESLLFPENVNYLYSYSVASQV